MRNTDFRAGKMKFQIASDLHLDMLAHFPGYRVIEPAADADALILAGDIHQHARGLEAFADWPVPVLYVHGNHENYDGDWLAVGEALKRTARETGVHYLERSAVHFEGVRVIGTCLWTNYQLFGNAPMAMQAAGQTLSDHRAIRMGEEGPFLPEHALAEHRKSVAWLQEQLDQPFAGKTVVVSHHGPHPLSVHPRYEGDIVNAAFVSDLTPIVERADLWVHGHVHDSFDYRVGKCRVVVNPRGYARNRRDAKVPADVRWENPGFGPQLVVEV
jgi:Icc-related predicted phosphoesterase